MEPQEQENMPIEEVVIIETSSPQNPVAPAQKNELTMPMAVVISAIIIAIALVIVRSPSSAKPSTDANQPSATDAKSMVASILATKGKVNFAPVSAKDHIIGSANPKVTIVEYSDFECPYCKQFHTSLKEIMGKYGDSVALVYRHFPLDCVDITDPKCQPLHPKARNEAIASECATALGGNDAFWKFEDEIFSITPSNNGLDPAQLPVIAKDIGVDVTAFNTCLANKTYANVVSADAKDGLAAGVRGTPFSVVIDSAGNNYAIGGAVPAEALAGVIDSLIK